MIAGRGAARARAPVRADKAVPWWSRIHASREACAGTSVSGCSGGKRARRAARARVSVSPFSGHLSRYDVVEPLTAVRTSPEIADLCFA